MSGARMDLAGEEDRLADLLVRLIDRKLDERIGKAITRTGKVRAEQIAGVVPAQSGGTGSNTGMRPHTIDVHTNVEITDPQPGQVLVYYPDGVWRNVDFEAASLPEALTVGGEPLTIDGEILTIG